MVRELPLVVWLSFPPLLGLAVLKPWIFTHALQSLGLSFRPGEGLLMGRDIAQFGTLALLCFLAALWVRLRRPLEEDGGE